MVIAVPEIANFAVAANKDGLLEIVAIAGPTTDDQQFTGAVWLTQELPASPEGQDQWTPAWRSLGAPGGGQLAGITLARNSDGRLEAATLSRSETVWHARQDAPDGDWSDWESLGNPGSNITPPALAQNEDGRLELFAVSLFSGLAVWHRSQLRPGQNQWTEWRSLGFPASQGPLTVVAPTVARNKDGRLEVHLAVGGKIWHSWQKTANSPEWMPWSSLDSPDAHEDVGLPTVVLDGEGRLQVFAGSGAAIWSRRQHGPGQGPWEPWTLPYPEPAAGEPALAVAAQAGGRLVLFALRNTPEGSQSLEKLEQEATDGEKWLPGDPIDTGLLGLAEVVPKAGNPALATDSRGRLRLFLSVPGRIGIYALNQTNPAGGQWRQSINFFEAP